MKHLIKAVLIISISMVLAGAGSSVDRRQQWWSMQLDKLTAEKESLSSDALADPGLVDVLDREIGGARKVLNLLDTASADGSSLLQAPDSLSDREAEALAGEMITPLVSLKALETVSAGADAGMKEKLKQLTGLSVRAMVMANFSSDTDELAELVLKKDIPASWWEQAAGELFFESVMDAKDRYRNSALEHVMSCLRQGKSAYQGKHTRRELRAEILKEAMDYINGHELLSGTEINSVHLGKTPSWLAVKEKIEKDLRTCSEIMKMSPRGRSISPVKARHYRTNPSALDEAFFIHPRTVAYAENGAFMKHSEEGGCVTLAIPHLPDMEKIFDEIDSQRRRAIRYLGERGNAEYIRRVDALFERTIVRSTSHCNNAILYEEKLAKKKGFTRDKIKNFDEFEKAKSALKENLSLAYAYKEKSRDYLYQVWENGRMPGKRLATIHDYHLQRGERYAAFLENLFTGCRGLASFADRSLNDRLVLGSRRIDGAFVFIKGLSVMDRECVKDMEADRIRSARAGSLEFSKQLLRHRRAIGESMAQYGMNYSEMLKKNDDREERVHSIAAQYEVDEVSRALKDYCELAATYGYAGEAFSRYRAAYENMVEEARSGRVTPEIRKIISGKRLMPVVDGFDTAKLKREMHNRNFCSQRIKTLVSRLRGIVGYYELQGSPVRDYPDSEELARMEAVSDRRPSADIATWQMNEGNYELVDRKAALMVESVLNRSIWTDRGADNVLSGSESYSLNVAGGKMTLKLPRGWVVSEKGGTADDPVVKSFRSLDDSAHISIVRIAMENRTIEEISRLWLSREGGTPLRKQWEKHESLEYFRTIARQGDGGVRECYAVRQGDYALIIEGETDRKRYSFFRGRLEAVFRSLEF